MKFLQNNIFKPKIFENEKHEYKNALTIIS